MQRRHGGLPYPPRPSFPDVNLLPCAREISRGGSLSPRKARLSADFFGSPPSCPFPAPGPRPGCRFASGSSLLLCPRWSVTQHLPCFSRPWHLIGCPSIWVYVGFPRRDWGSGFGENTAKPGTLLSTSCLGSMLSTRLTMGGVDLGPLVKALSACPTGVNSFSPFRIPSFGSIRGSFYLFYLFFK